jgi:hypothetical protein
MNPTQFNDPASRDGEQPVRFAGSVLGEKRHICAFFNSPEDGVSDLLEYEARFNLVPCHQHPVICTYDIGKFRGDVLMGVLRTHPMIILGGILQENPFFVPPDQFARELREREARRLAS